MRVRSAFFAVVCALVVSGCGGDGPTEPAACTNLGGPWRVLFRSSCGTQWSESLVIRQSGCRFEGAGPLIPISFSGDISGNAVTIRINIAGACPATANGTGEIRLDAVEGSFQATGTGGAGCCGESFTGAFTFLPPS